MPETSPHAWRKLHICFVISVSYRNISTCVEKTDSLESSSIFLRKHLHMRGENWLRPVKTSLNLETSPHAWRKPMGLKPTGTMMGNISTCVEKTEKHKVLRRILKKHLHMRGENILRSGRRIFFLETSPHAWRKRYLAHNISRRRRNISTCVEKTAWLPAYPV